MKKGKKILKVMAVAIVGLLLLGLVVMGLWNWLVPSLFNGPELTFWQALGLFILAKILFGGWSCKGGWRSGAEWKHRYYEKLSSMTPEERERFKQRMKEKWCRTEPSNPDAHTNV